MEYIFWCKKCLKKTGEGIAARVHPTGETGAKAKLFDFPGDGEHEMACPVCGEQNFLVNVLLTRQEETAIRVTA